MIRLEDQEGMLFIVKGLKDIASVLPSKAVFHVAGVFAYRGCITSSEGEVVAERCQARLTFPNPLLKTALGGFSSINPLMGSPKRKNRGGGRGDVRGGGKGGGCKKTGEGGGM